jgi:diguanylate cyclase (GGDEF)-like protein
MEDLPGEAPAERLLAASWAVRARRAVRRELVGEGLAAAGFCAAAAFLLARPGAAAGFDPGVAALLLVAYAGVAQIRLAVGVGHLAPTQLVLVPMLVLLPPATVPPLAVAGLLAAALGRLARGQARLESLLFSVGDGWHTIGAAGVVIVAAPPSIGFAQWPLLVAAFAAGCLVDLLSSMARELVALGIAPRLQLDVIRVVWAVDAGLAPVGFLAAVVAERSALAVLLVLPLAVLLRALTRDRSARIQQAQDRLELVQRERARLQSALRRLGDAFAARLDLDALLEIVVRVAHEALDADAALLRLPGPPAERRLASGAAGDLAAALELAAGGDGAAQVEHPGGWTLALPFVVSAGERRLAGTLAVGRRARAFGEDEAALLGELVDKARLAAGDIVAHQALREQAVTDALTGLGNRRKLTADLTRALQRPGGDPAVLLLFDLDGFKGYNDTFGHLAGDALLARLGAKLDDAVGARGRAYRLGGDEFCALLALGAEDVAELIARTAAALSETGRQFAIRASLGAVLLPHEADRPDHALQLADERMYAHKRGRPTGPRDQARDVLVRTMHAKQPDLDEHSSQVAQLAVRVARQLGLSGEDLDEIARAAELHDVGKVGIPDAILAKPAPLTATEWAFMHQHTILGERILNAAPALRPVARLVRASHERWDGTGYPDGLRGEAIPLGARVVAVCDAYEAMTADRPYRRALAPQAALAELRAHAGTQFDPAVVAAFVAALAATGDRREAAPADGAREAAAHIRALLDRALPPASAPVLVSGPTGS